MISSPRDEPHRMDVVHHRLADDLVERSAPVVAVAVDGAQRVDPAGLGELGHQLHVGRVVLAHEPELDAPRRPSPTSASTTRQASASVGGERLLAQHPQAGLAWPRSPGRRGWVGRGDHHAVERGVGGERHRVGRAPAHPSAAATLARRWVDTGRRRRSLDMRQRRQRVGVERSHAADTDHTHPHVLHAPECGILRARDESSNPQHGAAICPRCGTVRIVERSVITTIGKSSTMRSRRTTRPARHRDGVRRSAAAADWAGPRQSRVPVPPRRHQPADAGQHRRGHEPGDRRRARPATAAAAGHRAVARGAGRRHRRRPRASSSGPANIVVQPGGKPVITKFIQTLMNPGDGVLYPNPGYPIYESQIDYFGGRPLPYRYHETPTGFGIDLDQLRELAPQARLLIYNNLQNPLGARARRRRWPRSPAWRWSTTCGCCPTRPTSRCATRARRRRSPRCRAWPSAR